MSKPSSKTIQTWHEIIACSQAHEKINSIEEEVLYITYNMGRGLLWT